MGSVFLRSTLRGGGGGGGAGRRGWGRSAGPFCIPSPLLCLQVICTFRHGQTASLTSVSSRTFKSFGDEFSTSKCEGREQA